MQEAPIIARDARGDKVIVMDNEQTLFLNAQRLREEKPKGEKEKPKISVSGDKFFWGAHRGHGERTPSIRTGKGGFQNVDNTLTGIETGAVLTTDTIFTAETLGGNTFEIDIVVTADGKVVTGHGSVLQKLKGEARLPKTETEFLQENPDAFKLTELVDWLGHQPDQRFRLYVELKSLVEPARVIEALQKADPTGEKKLSERLMVYSNNLDWLKTYTQAKTESNLGTEQLKLWWLTDSLVDKTLVDQAAAVGDVGNHLYGLEQGMVVWANEMMRGKLTASLTGEVTDGETKMSLIDYLHKKGLKLIVGTTDNPEQIREVVELGVDGVMPNNPVGFEKAGLELKAGESKWKVEKYVPESMTKRIETARAEKDKKALTGIRARLRQFITGSLQKK